jgi:hypothetical protein
MNHNISHARVNTLFFSYNIDSREKRAMYQIYNGLSASLKSLFFIIGRKKSSKCNCYYHSVASRGYSVTKQQHSQKAK